MPRACEKSEYKKYEDSRNIERPISQRSKVINDCAKNSLHITIEDMMRSASRSEIDHSGGTCYFDVFILLKSVDTKIDLHEMLFLS